MSQWINLHALWQILVAGLICGAGLPALFVFGVRAMAWTSHERPVAVGDDPVIGGDRVVGGNPVGMAIACVCFALTAIGVGWGLYFIVSTGH